MIVAAPAFARQEIVINDDVAIPVKAATDLAAFRRWAMSDDFPERGRYTFMMGSLWVDLSMEQLFTHNRVTTRVTTVLFQLAESEKLGYFFSDGARVSHPPAGLSVEPDGVFVSYAAVRDGRAELIEGDTDGHLEIQGTPDMVLEVVSDSSVRKDTIELRSLYHEAGVPEYWLIDARGKAPRFDLLRRGPKLYAAVRRQAGGWVRSEVFGRSFQLGRQTDPLGHPQFTLAVRD
jgi:Uma2 family endonuclease